MLPFAERHPRPPPTTGQVHTLPQATITQNAPRCDQTPTEAELAGARTLRDPFLCPQPVSSYWASLVARTVKDLPSM